MNENWTKSWASVHVIAETEPNKKEAHIWSDSESTCILLLCVKNTKKPLLLLENVLEHSLTWCQDFWKSVTPETKTSKTSVSGPEMPAVTLNPLASEAEGCFGSAQVEVRRLCVGQVCDYVSGVVFYTGAGASWLPSPSESHRIMRLEYQQFGHSETHRQNYISDTEIKVFNKGFNMRVTFDSL